MAELGYKFTEKTHTHIYMLNIYIYMLNIYMYRHTVVATCINAYMAGKCNYNGDTSEQTEKIA